MSWEDEEQRRLERSKPSQEVRVTASLPNGEKIASWTTDEQGTHRRDRVVVDVRAERVMDIASVCHDANRAYCLTLGDHSQPSWDSAPDWQRASACDGVRAIAEGRVQRPEDSHRSWYEHKKSEGWVYGAVKHAEHKTHPCMLPFDMLSPAQQAKDYLFFTIATTLLTAYGLIDVPPNGGNG